MSPPRWVERVSGWHALNKGLRKRPGGHFIPDRNDEYFLYQNLAGAWPFPGKGEEEFPQRMRIGRQALFGTNSIHFHEHFIQRLGVSQNVSILQPKRP